MRKLLLTLLNYFTDNWFSEKLFMNVIYPLSQASQCLAEINSNYNEELSPNIKMATMDVELALDEAQQLYNILKGKEV